VGFPLIGQTGSVMGITFSITGDTMFTCSSDNTIISWNMNTYSPILTYSGHSQQVNSISITPDGRKLLSSSWDNNLILWNLERHSNLFDTVGAMQSSVHTLRVNHDNGKLIAIDNSGNVKSTTKNKISQLISLNVKEAYSRPTSFVTSKDAKYLFCGYENGTIKCWNMLTKKIEFQFLTSHINAVTHLAINPLQDILASGGDDGFVFIWNSKSGKQIGECIKGRRAEVTDLSFNYDGKYLAAGYNSSTVFVWDWQTGKAIEPPIYLEGYIRSVQFSPTNNEIAISNAYNYMSSVFIYDLKIHGFRDHEIGNFQSEHSKFRFSTDGHRLITDGQEGVQILDVENRVLMKKFTYPDDSDLPQEFILSPKNDLIVTSLKNKSIKIESLSTGSRKEIITSSHVTGFAFLNDSEFVAGSRDSVIEVYNCYSSQFVYSFREDFAANANCADYLQVREDEWVAIGLNDGTVDLIKMDENAKKFNIKISSKPIQSLTFNPKNKFLIVGGNDSILRICDPFEKNIIFRVVKIPDYISKVACSHDGKKLAVGTSSGFVYLYDFKNLDSLGLLVGHSRRINCIKFSPDDSQIASASYDRLINMWDVKSQKIIGNSFIGHQNQCWTLEFSPDGSLLASGGSDRKIFLWNLKKHTRYGSSFSSSGQIFDLAFSPDSKYLYSTGSDKVITKWNLDPAIWLKIAQSLHN